MTAPFTSKADFYEGSPVLGGGGGGGTPTPPAASTGVTAGSPGSFTPAGSNKPDNTTELAGITPVPPDPWTAGQYVVLDNGTEAYWDGSQWVVGRVGAPAVDPVITTLTPATGVVSTPQTITVAGTGFDSTSKVEVNGTAATTSYVSATELTVTWTPAITGAAQFSVRNGSNMESNSVSFDVTDAPPPPPAESNPQISSLSPIGATTTDPTPITITVTGTEFVDGSTVEVNQQAQQTTYVSATQLTALFAPSAAGSYTFTVRNPDGGESGDVIFTVT